MCTCFMEEMLLFLRFFSLKILQHYLTILFHILKVLHHFFIILYLRVIRHNHLLLSCLPTFISRSIFVYIFSQKNVNPIFIFQGAKLRSLPPILSLSLLRFSYDFNRGQRYKETGNYIFPLELDMGPYCEKVCHQSPDETHVETMGCNCHM